jgi:hypothetical protein
MPTLYRGPDEGIGLAARVLLHLSRLKKLGPNDVARLDATQQGMVSAFGVRQSSLGRVLQHLLAGDVVTAERRFVVGANRRMKVYRLTALGESTARMLERRASEPAVPVRSNEWVVGPAVKPGDA